MNAIFGLSRSVLTQCLFQGLVLRNTFYKEIFYHLNLLLVDANYPYSQSVTINVCNIYFHAVSVSRDI